MPGRALMQTGHLYISPIKKGRKTTFQQPGNIPVERQFSGLAFIARSKPVTTLKKIDSLQLFFHGSFFGIGHILKRSAVFTQIEPN